MRGCINFRWGSFWFEIGGYSAFFKSQSYLRATSPAPFTLIISLNTSNQNLEIQILFIIVEGFWNYATEEDTPALQLSEQDF